MAPKYENDEISLTQALIGIGVAVLFIVGQGYILMKLIGLL